MKKILIVVDMQNDFCLESGSLYVKGATLALWNVEELMYKEYFDRVWFTVDWHAFFHPSFKENGGEWPVHCVQYSQGAAINDWLLTACRNNNLRYDVIEKGDVGDFDPIQDLWKTEVYRLARWICDYCTMMSDGEDVDKIQAIRESVALTPTDGLGISNSDLEQIGARTYYDVDRVLQTLICKASPENDKLQDSLEQELGREVVHKIIKRHTASEFKRKKAPIYITREKYEND